MKIVYALLSISIAIAVMFVSITRASLEIIAQEEKEGRLRVDKIVVTVDEEVVEYQLPQIKMLPNNPFYGLKQLRDSLWVALRRDDVDKAEVLMIIGDKKLAESLVLQSQGDLNRALDSSEEAVSKLEYAWSLVNDRENEKEEALLTTIHRATKAYGQVIKELGEETMDRQKYEELENKMETFKQKEAEAYSE